MKKSEYTITVGFSGTDPIMKIRVRDYKPPIAQCGMYQIVYTDMDGNTGWFSFNDNVPVVIEPIN